MTVHSIQLGISTCPNDTWAFHGLMNRCVDLQGLDFSVELLDVEELNQQLVAGTFDVAKASFHAALYLSRDYWVMPSGSAVGYGAGPLLLAGPGITTTAIGRPHRDAIVLCPGARTTATMLYNLLFPGCGEIRQVVFSQILPMLRDGRADFGVCIHEGRFTWKSFGLSRVADLGELWEQQTGLPLPLGGILGKRSLGIETLRRVQRVIRSSLDYADAHPGEALVTMRKYAQEFQDQVLMKHVELYVNDETRELGSKGRASLDELSRRVRESGWMEEDAPPLQVLPMDDP